MWCSQGLCLNALFINHALKFLGPKLSRLYLCKPAAATVAKEEEEEENTECIFSRAFGNLFVEAVNLLKNNSRWQWEAIIISLSSISWLFLLTTGLQSSGWFFFSIEIFHKAQSLAPFCQKATVQRLFVHCDKWQSKAVNHTSECWNQQIFGSYAAKKKPNDVRN